MDEFKYLETLRARARHDEAQAIHNAEKHAEKRRDEHWRSVVADVVADKDAVIADKDAENEKLRQMIASLQANIKNQDKS